MLEDAQIIEGCIKKDTQCRAMLYEKYAPFLYGVALRYTQTKEDAEDILHDSFLHIFDNLTKFEGKSAFPYWLKSLVINQALSYYRRRVKMKSTDFNSYKAPIEDKTIVNSDMLTHQILLGFIRELPQGQQTVFNLCAIEGYSYHEAAKEIHCTESTCRTQLLRAKIRLRERINDFLKK